MGNMQPSRSIERVEGSPTTVHGRLADPSWALPRLAVECDEDARPGYKTRKANEYLDEPEVLEAKVRVLARLLRESRHCVAYTGAGTSTASGIQDYATRAGSKSLAFKDRPAAPRSPLEAKPTLAHKVMVSLYRAGLLKYWIQQNHDGLPQKAGFPQHAMNEIHGAWFDPSNPVVPMSGQLRDDLFSDLVAWERKADLVLALGTSMCGMNADRVAVSCAQREGTLGTVIVGLQETQYDHLSCLRFYSTIDSVMHLLATELGLSENPAPAAVDGRFPTTGEEDVFVLPYDREGERTEAEETMRVDLRTGSVVVITKGMHQGSLGVIRNKNADGHYRVVVAVQKPGNTIPLPVSFMFGSWWLVEGQQGLVPYFPLRNAEEGEASPAQLELLAGWVDRLSQLS